MSLQLPSRQNQSRGSNLARVLFTAGLAGLLFLFDSSIARGQEDAAPPEPVPQSARPQSQSASPPIIIRTHTYEVHFTPSGGVPIRWDIIDPVVIGPEPGRPVSLIAADNAFTQSKPFEIDIPPENDRRPRDLNTAVYHFEQYRDDDWHVISFQSHPTPEGMTITKTYRIPDRGFESALIISLKNESLVSIEMGDEGRGLGVTLGPGLGTPPQPGRGVGSGLYSFVRPVLGTAQEIRQLELDDEQTEVQVADSIQWGGIHQRYFLASLASDLESSAESAFSSSRSWVDPHATGEAAEPAADPRFFPHLTLFGSPISIAPNEIVELRYFFFFGPKDLKLLRSTSNGLDGILFPGLWSWMRWLCFAIMWLLDLLHAIIPSWGLSIIGLAVVIRLITLPLAHVGLKHQARIAAQQTVFNKRMAEINEKYKDDPKRRSQESWEAYKEDGVGPVSTLKGCLWLIVQIPIFVALFNLLGQSFALRGASFLWIDDLAAPDRLVYLGINLPFFGEYFNILPFLMAATQVYVSNISASSQANPKEKAKQKWFMVVLAVVFLVLFYSFPAGLVLYWMTSNLAQLLQQWLVGRSTGEQPNIVRGEPS